MKKCTQKQRNPTGYKCN